MTPALANRLPRAWYDAPFPTFLAATPDTILGALTRASGDHAVEPAQTQAWLAEIALLKSWLAPYTAGAIHLEFTIPRMGRRIDAVLLIGELVVVIEFKVGQGRIERAALDQAWDYALDLKNFHAGSHVKRIVPLLVATEYSAKPKGREPGVEDSAASRSLARYRPSISPATAWHAPWRSPWGRCPRCWFTCRRWVPAPDPDAAAHDAATWTAAPYRPTPTIVEAARALYAQHSVQAIARHDAEATNLRLTSQRLETLVDEARTHDARSSASSPASPAPARRWWA
jgi:hypothetical protein